jgi:phage terminase large subunit-like protein
MLWSHTPREPWQTGEAGARYYAEQARLLRPTTFDRLHRNQWTSGESKFITPEQYDRCEESSWGPLDPTTAHPLWVGVDASTKRDSTAVVAVLRDEIENLVVVAQHRVWTPSAQHPLDLEAVEAYLLDLARQYDLRTVRCDPYQFHGSMQRLRQHGLPVEEYPQTEDRLTRIGQGLYDLIRERRLIVYPSDELRAHVLAASAKETPHGFRIVKTVATKKIDACVALAMAAHAATTAPVWAEPRLFALGG